jgi:hypothetical protein
VIESWTDDSWPNRDQRSNGAATDRSERGVGKDRSGHMVQFVASGAALHNGCETATGPHLAIEGDGDDIDRTLEFVCQNCFGRVSRARARYDEGDAGCEGDYRAAFLLDARLTASAFIRELKGQIRHASADLVRSCMVRLIIDPSDVVTLARLGVTFLLLHKDDEAFPYLERALVQNPSWRSFLRFLVKKAKVRRAREFASNLERHRFPPP